MTLLVEANARPAQKKKKTRTINFHKKKNRQTIRQVTRQHSILEKAEPKYRGSLEF